MSLLSSTQGTPERVWSLVSALVANEGSLDRLEASEWLSPGFTRNGQTVSEQTTAFQQTLGAATSLGAIEVDGSTLRMNPGCDTTDFDGFCDWVHGRLIALDSGEKDAVVLETFAWVAAESDHQGSIGWMNDWTSDDFADAADRSLPEGSDDDGDRRINRVKLPSWRRWLISLGLMVPLPIRGKYLPFADARAARELTRADLPKDEEIKASAFLAALAMRLPYLDGGRMFIEAMQRQKYAKATRQLSPLLSVCLRNMNDEGLIELNLRGDSGDVVSLSQDTHRVQAFESVIVREFS